MYRLQELITIDLGCKHLSALTMATRVSWSLASSCCLRPLGAMVVLPSSLTQG